MSLTYEPASEPQEVARTTGSNWKDGLMAASAKGTMLARQLADEVRCLRQGTILDETRHDA